eukprot:scaffold31_cov334-Pavlova_lutheri.AAC.25
MWRPHPPFRKRAIPGPASHSSRARFLMPRVTHRVVSVSVAMKYPQSLSPHWSAVNRSVSNRLCPNLSRPNSWKRPAPWSLPRGRHAP